MSTLHQLRGDIPGQRLKTAAGTAGMAWGSSRASFGTSNSIRGTSKFRRALVPASLSDNMSNSSWEFSSEQQELLND